MFYEHAEYVREYSWLLPCVKKSKMEFYVALHWYSKFRYMCLFFIGFFFFIVLVWEWSIGVLNGFFVYMHENMLTVFVWKTLMYVCTCVQYLYALPVAGVVIIKIYINQLLLVNATIFAIKSKRMWNTFFNLPKY